VSAQLFSPFWYRVANLRPRLRGHVEIHHHIYRDELWYLIQDHITGRFHRFTPETYTVIGLMDGRKTLDQIWEIACERLGDSMPPQDEIIRLLGQLYQADVIQANLPPDMGELHKRQRKVRHNRLLAKLKSPLAIKIPLWDPNRFLEKSDWIAHMLFSPLGWLVWLSMVGLGAVLAGIHWEVLTENLADRVLALENLLLLWLVYPIVKGIHELGHGYAVRRWGGEVHEMGIMFLVFIPVPYVEASASYAFGNKYHRMLVGGVGILTELFLAAVAMVVWVLVEPGAVRVLAFNVMLICGISTVLFNGNPLLRFDAYYVLADLLEIPDLGRKSNRQLGYLLKHYLLGLRDEAPPARSNREGFWLILYSISAFAYRMFIMLTIALFVASKLFIIGILLAIWSIYGFLFHPLFKLIKDLSMDERLKKKRVRLFSITSGVLAMLILLLFWTPLPKMTVAEGVLWIPGDQRIVVATRGTVDELLVTDGMEVKAGMPLIRLSNQELEAKMSIAQGRLQELMARLRISQSENRVTESQLIEEEILRLRKQLEQLNERLQLLLVHSPQDGVFHFSRPDRLQGRFLNRGEALGYILLPGEQRVRVLVDQEEVDAARGDVQEVSVRFSEQFEQVYPARLIREIPSAHRELPSLALSVDGGGKFALDPGSTEIPKAFEAFFQFEIALPEVATFRLGERVYVRFKHTPEPIAYRWLREARRLLLEHIDF